MYTAKVRIDQVNRTDMPISGGKDQDLNGAIDDAIQYVTLHDGGDTFIVDDDDIIVARVALVPHSGNIDIYYLNPTEVKAWVHIRRKT